MLWSNISLLTGFILVQLSRVKNYSFEFLRKTKYLPSTTSYAYEYNLVPIVLILPLNYINNAKNSFLDF